MSRNTIAVTFNKDVFCNGPCGPHNRARAYPAAIEWNKVYLATASKCGQFWDFNVQVGKINVPAQFNELTSLLRKDLWTWLQKDRLRDTMRSVRAKQKDLQQQAATIKRLLRRKKL